jgi:threonyl-tRNA synthetase
VPEITVTLPDGSAKSVPEGATVLDVAAAIGARLAAAAVAGKVDGTLADLGHVVSDGQTVAIVTESSPEGLDVLRHSTAHVMAEAVKDLFPTAKFGIGPSIESCTTERRSSSSPIATPSRRSRSCGTRRRT